jgi:hypothetical protein
MRRSGWSIELVGRYHDTLHRLGGAWRFQRRFAELAAVTSPAGGQPTKSGTTSCENRSTWSAPALGQPHTR